MTLNLFIPITDLFNSRRTDGQEKLKLIYKVLSLQVTLNLFTPFTDLFNSRRADEKEKLKFYLVR